MMEKLGIGKYLTPSAEEVSRAVSEIRGYIEKYGWEGHTVAPYGHGIKILDFLAHFDDYDRCTADSRDVMILELNGLIEHCINPWLRTEQEPKVTIRLTDGGHKGEIRIVPKSTADFMIECNFAEVI